MAAKSCALIALALFSYTQLSAEIMVPASDTELRSLQGGACMQKSTQSAGCNIPQIGGNPTCQIVAGKLKKTKTTYSGQQEAICAKGGANKTCGNCGTLMTCVTTESGCDTDGGGNCINCNSTVTSQVNSDCVVGGTCTTGT